MTMYIRPVSNTWWLDKKQYILFVIREFTSIFVAVYCLFLLFFIFKIGDENESFNLLIQFLKSPLILALHLISFPFILYHTITWFNLTPKIMVVQIGEGKVPKELIAGLVYISWVLLSFILIWLILGL